MGGWVDGWVVWWMDGWLDEQSVVRLKSQLVE